MRLKLGPVLLAGAALRVLLLAYGAWHDASFRVKFTDVDYEVLSDGAGYVAAGASPYLRETYRYTPLLAMLLVPNAWTLGLWGKLCFAAADVLATLLIHRVLRLRGVDEALATGCAAALWCFNPLVVVVSMRGNAESLVAMLVLLALCALHERAVVLAALAFGAAVHLKPFPVLYALPIYFFLDEHAFPVAGPTAWRARLLSCPRLTFALVSAGTFAVLGAVMYWLYGWAFVHDTYLYHLLRKDHRHNFSMYFYPIYLDYAADQSTLMGLVAFVPQAAVLALVGWAFYRDIVFCCFAQTFAFVAFNKVCTSQYFIWYITFAPLLAPFTTLPLLWTGAGLIALWAGAQAAWLQLAYMLEFEGRDTFGALWLASGGFFAVNVLLLCVLVAHHRFAPVFDRGALVAEPRAKSD